MASESVGAQILRGSAWMVGMRWALRLIGLVSTAVLARLLTPADFGIVAMAMIVSGLLDTAAYAGVDLALIRAGAHGREYQDTAWTIQLLQALIVGALLLVAAPLAASYFGEPRVAGVIAWLALKSALDGFTNIGIVAFRKELDFAREFRFNFYSKMINLVVVVTAAWLLRNYLALVIGLVSGSLITVLLSYVMHPYRPRLSLSHARELWGFSNWLLVSRIGSFASRKADQFMVGGAVGATALGSYHVGNELSTLPTMELVMPMRRALFPTLSRLRDDPASFRAAVLNTFSVLSILCFAIGFGMVSVAAELVPLVLGAQWKAAIPLVQWLALYGAFAGLASVLEVPMWVEGRTDVSALQSWVEVVLLVPLMLLALRAFGVEGAALSRALIAAAILPFMLWLAARVCPLSFRELFAALWRPLTAAIAMALLLRAPLPYPDGLVPTLIVKVLLGALFYAAALACLWLVSGRPAGGEATLLRAARAALGRG
jgi:O-antigen/teichoic acid export membrane protein